MTDEDIEELKQSLKDAAFERLLYFIGLGLLTVGCIIATLIK